MARQPWVDPGLLKKVKPILLSACYSQGPINPTWGPRHKCFMGPLPLLHLLNIWKGNTNTHFPLHLIFSSNKKFAKLRPFIRIASFSRKVILSRTFPRLIFKSVYHSASLTNLWHDFFLIKKIKSTFVSISKKHLLCYKIMSYCECRSIMMED